MIRFNNRLALGLAALALCAAPASAEHHEAKTDKADKNIVQTAAAVGQFETLLAAATAAGLGEALSGEGPLTVFAPTDEAFANLPEGTVETLLKPENKDQLAAVLTYHVVAGKVPAADAVKLTSAETLNGQRLDLKVEDGALLVDGAKVVKADVMASNGVIHVVDAVLLPSADNIVETAQAAGSFNTLVAAVKAAGLAEALGGKDALTVFAPTDEAFAKLPAGTLENLLKPENKDQLVAILKYHVVAGRGYSDAVLEQGTVKTLQGSSLEVKVKDDQPMVGPAKIVAADIDASNGVIHVIDQVLLP